MEEEQGFSHFVLTLKTMESCGGFRRTMKRETRAAAAPFRSHSATVHSVVRSGVIRRDEREIPRSSGAMSPSPSRMAGRPPCPLTGSGDRDVDNANDRCQATDDTPVETSPNSVDSARPVSILGYVSFTSLNAS